MWVTEGGVGRQKACLGREEGRFPRGRLCPIAQQPPYVIVILSHERSKLTHFGEMNLQQNRAGTVSFSHVSCRIEAEGPPYPTERGQEVRTRQAVHRWVWGAFVAHHHVDTVTLAGVDWILSAAGELFWFGTEFPQGRVLMAWSKRSSVQMCLWEMTGLRGLRPHLWIASF